MNSVSQDEIRRQYRVLKQTIGIHSILRDGYSNWETITQLTIVLSSLVICATVFATDEVYQYFNLSPTGSRIILGIASIVIFGLSLVILFVDLRGKSIEHRDAADKLTQVLQKFRENKTSTDTWPEGILDDLSRAYWEANNNSIKIPDAKFNGLKSKYLKKVAVSELKDSYPGCPVIILSVLLFFRDSYKASKEVMKNNRNN